MCSVLRMSEAKAEKEKGILSMSQRRLQSHIKGRSKMDYREYDIILEIGAENIKTMRVRP